MLSAELRASCAALVAYAVLSRALPVTGLELPT
jgi:hypothetical protein